MSVLKHLKTDQHVSIYSDHLPGARRCLCVVQSSITCGVCVCVCVCVWCRAAKREMCVGDTEQHNVWCVCVVLCTTHTHLRAP
jgi:hypothetical protein